MCLGKAIAEWQKGLEEFIETTFKGTSRGGTAPCPCSRCRTMSFRTKSEVQSHLISRGFDASFIQGELDGVDSDEDNTCDEGGTGDGGSVTDLVSSLIRGTIHGEIIGTNNEEPNDRAKTLHFLNY